jgi:hypothetical protein
MGGKIRMRRGHAIIHHDKLKPGLGDRDGGNPELIG